MEGPGRPVGNRGRRSAPAPVRAGPAGRCASTGSRTTGRRPSGARCRRGCRPIDLVCCPVRIRANSVAMRQRYHARPHERTCREHGGYREPPDQESKPIQSPAHANVHFVSHAATIAGSSSPLFTCEQPCVWVLLPRASARDISQRRASRARRACASARRARRHVHHGVRRPARCAEPAVQGGDQGGQASMRPRGPTCPSIRGASPFDARHRQPLSGRPARSVSYKTRAIVVDVCWRCAGRAVRCAGEANAPATRCWRCNTSEAPTPPTTARIVRQTARTSGRVGR